MDVEVFLGAGLYFIPTFIAASRNNPKLRQIGFCNLVLGWTGLGWIAVLAFALGEPAADEGATGATTAAAAPPVPPKDPAEELCRELAEIRAPKISDQAREVAEQLRFARECFCALKDILDQKFKPSELAYERFLTPASTLYQSVLDNGALMLSTLVSLELSWRKHALDKDSSAQDEATFEAGVGRVEQLKQKNEPAISGFVQTTSTLSQLHLVDGRIPEAVDDAMRQLEKVVARAPLYDCPQYKD